MALRAIRKPDCEYGTANSSDVQINNGKKEVSKVSNFGPSVGNFCIQYNFSSASIAIAVLSSKGSSGKPYSEEPAWANDVILPVVFLGSMIGMSCMGWLGDVIGRSKAMQATLWFAIAGAFVPSCAAGPPNAVYGIVCAGRFLLGIGLGGIYPLSAVSSAEGQADAAKKSETVARAFVWQAIGAVVPYMVAMLLLGLIHPQPAQEWVPSFEYRLLFGLGIVPLLIVLVDALKKRDIADFSPQREGVLQSLRCQRPETLFTLAGTAGSWLLFDVAIYGIQIYTPIILIDMFGEQQSLFQTAWQSVVTLSMSIPAVIVSSLLVTKVGCKRLNVIGFLLMAVNFVVLALVWGKASKGVVFAAFCVLNFCMSFGCDVGTFVLPAICFPMEVRSTCHGISATCGKLGALIGVVLFPIISNGPRGISGLLWMQAGVCFMGAVISQYFLKHDWEYINGDSTGVEAAVLPRST